MCAFSVAFAPFLTLIPGMNVAAGPDLAAAVTNVGGLGVIGSVGHMWSPSLQSTVMINS